MRQFKRVRPVLLLLALLAFIPATVRADHRGELEDAKRDLERAKRRYAHAAAAVDAARCALDQARAARDSAARDLRHTTESIYQLESWLAGAEDDLRQAQADLAHVEQELAARRSAADETERLVNESAAELRQIREQARAAFEQSPKHVEARDAILRQQGRLDDAVEAVHQRLANDPAYEDLLDAARRAEADVNRLRHDPRVRPEELAPVSQAWIDAKAAVQHYQEQAIDTDPQVQNARAALDVEMDRREALVQAFEQALAADPQFVAADQRFRDAERF
jgi:septal ring factor EnvC (AmiA/AmiB activator)